tara:strand:- start:844 stop:2325 length:1482 start_codon:yes stop_codon:yes gene_type:complete
MKKKLLVLIVAYNHEKFIKNVLDRINNILLNKYEVEILINDDSSTDETLQIVREYVSNKKNSFKYTILSNPVNQGYGGNQKIGFNYAIKNRFDYVALVHGDGQYAPEYLENLLKPVVSEDVDFVWGSRMINKNGALKGGMPLYKFIGNKILTWYQNFMFKTNFTEFHSGYRVYKVSSLEKIPFELNSNDHSFDNEIIAQYLISDLKIKEVAIPTYYGDEISYVNGLKYAYQVFIINIKAKFQKIGIFHDRRFDCYKKPKGNYVLKNNFESTHKKALDIIEDQKKVLDIGCNNGELGELFAKKNCEVTGIDLQVSENQKIKNFITQNLDDGLPEIDYDDFDYILLLDVIEHLKNPENFMIKLKNKLKNNSKAKILISTPNIAFFVIRFMLLFGKFNYGSRGILDKTHTRLFTFSSFSNLVNQSDFTVLNTHGVPAPFQLAIGNNFFSKLLTKINVFLIKLSKRLFSFQIFLIIKPNISLDKLLEEAKTNADNKI